MELKKYSLLEHFVELKRRTFYVLIFYLVSFLVSYYFSKELLNFLILPLSKLTKNHEMIYTSLQEGFLSYIRMSSYFGFFFTLPFIIFQIYQYIKPGIYKNEQILLRLIFIISVFVFYLGILFVYYLVMPKAFEFFLKFETPNSALPVKLLATVSEYLTLSLHFMIVFGLIFEIPLLLATLCLFGFISIETLSSKRKFVILIAFILGGILTPPDIFSQFALAIPIILLYEISLLVLKFFSKKGIYHD